MKSIVCVCVCWLSVSVCVCVCLCVCVCVRRVLMGGLELGFGFWICEFRLVSGISGRIWVEEIWIEVSHHLI